MNRKTLVMFTILLALTCSVIPLGVYAEEEDEEDDDDRPGFGIQEREREREHEDEGASPFSGTILYVTIGAIAAAIGYTILKIVRSRKATKKLQ